MGRSVVTVVNEHDRDSIAGLFEAFAADLRRHARWVTGSEADADDAVQEVMLGLLEAPNLLAGVDRIAGWLLTLVRRRAIDILRSESRRHRRESDDAVAELLSTADDVEAGLERDELARAVATALRELPGPQREVFVANELEGVTFRELAERSGTPMGTLMARKKRAVDRIRAHLRREGWLPPSTDSPPRKELAP